MAAIRECKVVVRLGYYRKSITERAIPLTSKSSRREFRILERNFLGSVCQVGACKGPIERATRRVLL